MKAVNAASAISPENSTVPGPTAARLMIGPARRLGLGTRDLAGAQAQERRDRCERRRDHPRRGEPLAVEHGFTQHRTEREPAVHRDGPVADRLTPARGRSEVGDHRRRADEERGLAETGEQPRADEERQGRDDAVDRDRDRDDSRAEDDQDAAADPVAEAPDQRAQDDRSDEQRAHRDAHADAAPTELVLDVLRHDGQHDAERHEVREARPDDEREARA